MYTWIYTHMQIHRHTHIPIQRNSQVDDRYTHMQILINMDMHTHADTQTDRYTDTIHRHSHTHADTHRDRHIHT